MNDLSSGRLDLPLSARSLENLFGGRGWLSGASLDLRTRLLAEARTLEYPRGARVYALGDKAGGIYGVVSGGIGIEVSARGHPVRMGHVVRPGFWFGEGPIIGGGERFLGAIAVEDSLVIHLTLPTLKQLIQSNTEMQILLARLSQNSVQFAMWVTCDLLIPEAPRRIAAVLLRVSGALDGDNLSHTGGFPLNQTLLGELANASRVHVSRVLGRLAQMGLIKKRYNHLEILDPQGLARFAYDED